MFHMRKLIKQISQWHHDRNLVEGATDAVQVVKGLEEFMEKYAAIHAGKEPVELTLMVISELRLLHAKGRIKKVHPFEAREALADAIGDEAVVNINHCLRNHLDYEGCIEGSYNEIKHRKGRMIDGIFVKEADLETNLCDTCEKCFGSCLGDPVFGTGTPNADNVLQCNSYYNPNH